MSVCLIYKKWLLLWILDTQLYIFTQGTGKAACPGSDQRTRRPESPRVLKAQGHPWLGWKLAEAVEPCGWVPARGILRELHFPRLLPSW